MRKTFGPVWDLYGYSPTGKWMRAWEIDMAGSGLERSEFRSSRSCVIECRCDIGRALDLGTTQISLDCLDVDELTRRQLLCPLLHQ